MAGGGPLALIRTPAKAPAVGATLSAPVADELWIVRSQPPTQRATPAGGAAS